ncbi:SusC/RagA family TonB-linked outer membrane protein [Pedobacter faecalis]|uniref:SusC/RagA family TonB-linked outer membrane protein n=1 Tax=Pedobacter faecalis TaxID=3041495 RepID=UPI0025504CB5|nr:SusC/RagA family TonB-linked outer membrane protein [Pedobacter sp. ELA7]
MKKTAFNLRLSQAWLPPKILLIMKLIIIIMTACLMQVSAAGFAQKITYSKKGATLEEIFSEIRKQTGYYVVYAENKVNKEAKLDVNFRNTELNKVLDVISNSQNLEYSLDDKNISLKPKEESVIDRIIARFQAIDVRGKVVDSLGNGLAGATVSVKGGKGTHTLANGDFYIKNVKEDAVLVVSFLGYVPKEQKVKKDFVYVQLKLSSSKLDEIQIMAYGKTSRRLSTGNISTIKGDDLLLNPVDNPLSALIGRIPNLSVTPTSGLPGAPLKTQLRGQSSLMGTSSEPLIIVDGVPLSNNVDPGYYNLFSGGALSSLSLLNLSDIESVDILKDADATSIYGSRGGNGVILITTRKGNPGETKINMNGQFGLSSVVKKIPLLNTAQYLEMRREAFKNDGVEIQTTNPYEPGYAVDLSLWDQKKYTDWQEELLGKSARTYNFQGSISGGTSMIQYFLSGGYNTQGFVFPGDSNWQTGTGNISISGKSRGGKFQFNLNGGYSSNKSKTPIQTSVVTALTLPPNAPDIFNKRGGLNWETDPLTGLASWANPYAGMLNPNSSKANNLRSTVDIGYQATSELKVKATIGFNEVRTNSKYFETIAAQDPGIWEYVTGQSNFTNSLATSLNVDPQVNYSKVFKGSKLDILVGATLQSQNVENEWINGSGYTNDALLNSLGAAFSTNAINRSSQYKYFGVYSRANYILQNRYLLNVSTRRDGSSRFGPGNQFGNFASVGTAWIFSNESFFKSASSILSFGKIRASLGSSGNDGIGDYKYVEQYTTMNNVLYQGLRPLLTMGVTNPDYHWESIRKAEVGIELGLFKDKFIINATYFRHKSSSQLGGRTLPFTAGGLSVVENQLATIRNSGYELIINSVNIKTPKFNWNSSLTFGMLGNRLLAIPESFVMNSPSLLYYSERGESPIGKPFNGFVGAYEFKGVDPATGLYQFLTKAGTITTEADAFAYSKKVNIAPKFQGGLSNSISYSSFRVDFFVQVTKQLGYNPLHNLIFLNPGVPKNQLVENYNNWRNIGDKKSIQKFSQQGFNEAVDAYYRISSSDRAWVDASFIRLKNVALSYDLPPFIIKKGYIKNLRLFTQAQNLLTLTKYKGFDPETQDVASLPPLRTLSFGLSLGL